MNREKIIETVDKFLNFLKNVKFGLRIQANKDYRINFDDNKKFKGIHDGKRCFILGNGPSLKNQDLSVLSNEIVFTVNSIMNAPIYSTLNSNYHIMIDPEYFNLDILSSEDKERLESFKLINCSNNKPICIFPYDTKQKVNEYGISEFLNINYIQANLEITENFKLKIDMSKNMPIIQTVVHGAIYCAIYMGFNEIYILGCDMTGFLQHYEKKEDIFNNSSYNHIYEYTENERKAMLKEKLKYSNEFYLSCYAKMFTIFRRINFYAINKGIRIINLTDGGALDVFERANLQDILKR